MLEGCNFRGGEEVISILLKVVRRNYLMKGKRREILKKMLEEIVWW